MLVELEIFAIELTSMPVGPGHCRATTASKELLLDPGYFGLKKNSHNAPVTTQIGPINWSSRGLDCST